MRLLTFKATHLSGARLELIDGPQILVFGFSCVCGGGKVSACCHSCLPAAQEALLHQDVCTKAAVTGKLVLCADGELQEPPLLSPQIQIRQLVCGVTDTCKHTSARCR